VIGREMKTIVCVVGEESNSMEGFYDGEGKVIVECGMRLVEKGNHVYSHFNTYALSPSFLSFLLLHSLYGSFSTFHPPYLSLIPNL